MQIYINNLPATMKKGTSFEYVSENRLFSGSDGYTLTITFPLRGCPENLAIFGHINRADVRANKVVFDCEIRDHGFCKFGSITITEITESEVKTQFLEGRSEQNFDKTFDKVFINQLDLGEPASVNKATVTPSGAWAVDLHNPTYVALPWVNDYSGNIQNLAEVVIDNANQPNAYHYEWNTDLRGLSWQPYLIYIAKKICEAEEVGYTYDFSAWERSELKYLLICNCLPYAWERPAFALALPHWSVQEFFEKLELFLGGEFDFDHRSKHISFRFTQELLRSKDAVCIDKVVEQHTTEISVGDNNCEYSEAMNLKYKECDHDTWKYYSCDWFIKAHKQEAIVYDTLSELLEAQKKWSTWTYRYNVGDGLDNLYYAKDCDLYFVIQAIGKEKVVDKIEGGTHTYYVNRCILRPLNIFGDRIINEEEDAECVELEFVPVRLDYTEQKYGKCMFLSFGADDYDGEVKFENTPEYYRQSIPVLTLNMGEKEKTSEYYDRIYVGFWEGSQDTRKQLPYPWTENLEIFDDWSGYTEYQFSMRLNERTANSARVTYAIEQDVKVNFKFLADEIPDVRSLFFIRGKRYVCEKITAKFSEKGMSRLLSGIFWPIKEE